MACDRGGGVAAAAALAVLLASVFVATLGPSVGASAVETCVREIDATGAVSPASATVALRTALFEAADAGASGCTSWRVELSGTFDIDGPLMWTRGIPLRLVGPEGATARLQAVPASGVASVRHRILVAPIAVAVTLERLVLAGGDVSLASTGVDPLEDLFANRGGAVLAADLQLIDVELIDNRAAFGGAVAVTSRLEATRTSFVRNRAPLGSDEGGAVHALGDITLENVTFRANQAGVGGAIWMEASGALEATFVTFVDNIGDSGVGAPGADLHRGGTGTGSVSLRGVLFGGLGPRSNRSCGGVALPAVGSGLTAIGSFATESSCGAAATVVAAPTFDTVDFLPGTQPLRVVASGPQALAEVACGAGWPSVDQRGLTRPQGASCDAGSVERVVVVEPPVPPGPVDPPSEPSDEPLAGPVPTSVPAGDGTCADGCPGFGARGPAWFSRR